MLPMANTSVCVERRKKRIKNNIAVTYIFLLANFISKNHFFLLGSSLETTIVVIIVHFVVFRNNKVMIAMDFVCEKKSKVSKEFLRAGRIVIKL